MSDVWQFNLELLLLQKSDSCNPYEHELVLKWKEKSTIIRPVHGLVVKHLPGTMVVTESVDHGKIPWPSRTKRL